MLQVICGTLSSFPSDLLYTVFEVDLVSVIAILAMLCGFSNMLVITFMKV